MTLSAALFLGVACVAPIVQPAGNSELDPRHLPHGFESVEASTLDGALLRGVFVPATGNAPVVLHLLPSQTSITGGLGLAGSLAGMRETLEEFRARGFASLVMDYRGVGASGERRDPRRLGDDARAMWDEALRRVDGRNDRVVLRGASIGCLAAAALLDSGVTPGAVVMFAPVRAETIGRHAARERRGALLGALIAPFLRRPLQADLVETLATPGTPLLLVLPEFDAYLPPDETELLIRAATQSGARITRAGGSHQTTVLRAWGFMLDEESVQGHLAPELLPAEQDFLSEFAAPR